VDVLHVADPKELVIVDTCDDEPSQFWTEKAKADHRVIYRHFRVPESQWSIGLKRNLACYYASGDVIAHFDDDDIYAACYLETMIKLMQDPGELFKVPNLIGVPDELMQKMISSMGFPSKLGPPEIPLCGKHVVSRVLGDRFKAACAKLSTWHSFSVQTRGWHLVEAMHQNRERSDGDSQIYGWGFSLVYLRSLWEMCPFLHMDLGEDYDLVLSFRRLGMPVLLINDNKGMCGHTLHNDNTAISCSKNDQRGGASSMMYTAMAPLLSMYEKVAQDAFSAQGGQSPGGETTRFRGC